MASSIAPSAPALSGPELFFQAQLRQKQWGGAGVAAATIAHVTIRQQYRAPEVVSVDESLSDATEEHASAPTSTHGQTTAVMDDDLATATATPLPAGTASSASAATSSARDSGNFSAAEDVRQRSKSLPPCLRLRPNADRHQPESDPDSVAGDNADIAEMRETMHETFSRFHRNIAAVDREWDNLHSQVFDQRTALQEHRQEVAQLSQTFVQHIQNDAARQQAYDADRAADAQARKTEAELEAGKRAVARVAEQALADSVPVSAEGRVYCHPSEVRRLATRRPESQMVSNSAYPAFG